MAYLTKAQARNAGLNERRKFSSQVFESRTILDAVVRATPMSATFDVFLSHSVSDADLVLGIKGLLEEEGLKVYVDWDTDRQLDRSQVNAETAAVLRARMRKSKSMLYIATAASSGSKWMPWELGFFDGFRSNHVAILPVLDYSFESFEGQEYLGLYPTVEKERPSWGFREQVIVKDRYTSTSIKDFQNDYQNWR